MSLEIVHVSAGYPSQQVLDDVHLTVPKGQILALLGPNGAGKTTLLRVLSGTLAPWQGQVRWEGRDIHRLTPKERARLVAVVPQARALPPAFTVEQAVMLGRTPYLSWLGGAGPADWEAVQRALTQTDLLPLAARPLQNLSGGEQQRVLLARALAQETPLLLLDEPTTHLDLHHQTRLLALVRDLSRARGLTVVMVVHDLNQAARYADRVAILDRGRLVAAGSPAAVLTAERLTRVYRTPVEVLTTAQGWPVVVAAAE